MIKCFEGLRAQVYLDTAGKPTIGYGHLLKSGESFPEGITEPEAERLLQHDIEVAERAVSRLIIVPLTDHQFDAIVSFTFNLGSAALQRSTLRRKINAGLNDEVPLELMRWIWAGGRRCQGLMKRRKAEGEWYASSV